MRHIVIPDIHQRLAKLTEATQFLRKKGVKWDRTIYLGDFFDAYNSKPEEAEEMAETIGKNGFAETEQACLGNHDAHYFFAEPRFRCSGYNESTLRSVNKFIKADVRRQFKLFTHIRISTDSSKFEGKLVLFSHAGVHPNIWKEAGETVGGLEAQCQTALDMAFNGGFHRFFDVGGVRGGWAPFGGMTWLDWTYEFRPIHDVIQIVGHTFSEFVKCRPGMDQTPNWCIDTALDHIMVVDDQTGDFEVHPIIYAKNKS